MRVVLADAGLVFDGRTPAERPLGGAESAFIALAEAMAAAGAEVTALTRGARPGRHAGVDWADVSGPWPDAAELFIANRDPRLLWRTVKGAQRVFWLHNPAQFLTKPRYALPIAVKRPILVFAGPSHRATAPRWLFGARAVQIPLGVESAFLTLDRAAGPPAPRAIFASNPLRGLPELAQLWSKLIQPRLPAAELHVFAGPSVYGASGEAAARMTAALSAAAAAPGVVLRDPAPKAALARELAVARVMPYLGDPGETFCLAVAEAQAMGVPAVVRPVGAVSERVEHGKTGFIEAREGAFADAVLRLLSNDALWAHCSAAALARRAALGWGAASERFLALTSA